jgi:hypothetical protein
MEGMLFKRVDADGEYDVADIPQLVAPVARGDADVVCGSRFLLPENRFLSRRQQFGNQAVTRIFNLRSGTRLTDVERRICGWGCCRRR